MFCDQEEQQSAKQDTTTKAFALDTHAENFTCANPRISQPLLVGPKPVTQSDQPLFATKIVDDTSFDDFSFTASSNKENKVRDIVVLQENKIGKDYVCTDLHGTDMLQAFIQKAHPGQNDRIFFCGDALDRGQHSVALVEFLINNELIRAEGGSVPEIVSVMGNHDAMFLCWMALLKDKLINNALDDSCADYLECLGKNKSVFLEKLKSIDITPEDISAVKKRFGDKNFEDLAGSFGENLNPDWITPASTTQLSKVFHFCKNLPIITRVNAEHIESTFCTVHSDLPDDWNSLKTSPFLTPAQIFHALWARSNTSNAPKVKNANGQGNIYCGHTIPDGIRRQDLSELPIINLDFGASFGTGAILEIPNSKNSYQHHLHIMQQENQVWQYIPNAENCPLNDLVKGTKFACIAAKIRELVIHILNEHAQDLLRGNNNFKPIAEAIIKFEKAYEAELKVATNWLAYMKNGKFQIQESEKPDFAKVSQNDKKSFLEQILPFLDIVTRLDNFFEALDAQKEDSSKTTLPFWTQHANTDSSGSNSLTPEIIASKLEELIETLKKLQYSTCDKISFASINYFPRRLLAITSDFIHDLQTVLSPSQTLSPMQTEDIAYYPQLCKKD